MAVGRGMVTEKYIQHTLLPYHLKTPVNTPRTTPSSTPTPKSSQSPTKRKLRKEAEHQKLHQNRRKGKTSQETILSWGRRLLRVLVRKGNGFCLNPKFQRPIMRLGIPKIWCMIEDASTGIKLLRPHA